MKKICKNCDYWKGWVVWNKEKTGMKRYKKCINKEHRLNISVEKLFTREDSKCEHWKKKILPTFEDVKGILKDEHNK